jgi:hypothetical protein
MTTRRIIPDAYTDYEDGHLGVVAPSLANVECKIGAAVAGIPNKVYTLAGPDAKKQAKIIFKGGPLLAALEQAFDAGSTRVHAVRIGNPGRATLTLKAVDGTDTIRLKGDYGSTGNNHYVNVWQTIQRLYSGYVAIFEGSQRYLRFFDDGTFQNSRRFDLPGVIGQVVGVEADIVPRDLVGTRGFWVLGYTSDPGHQPTLWRFDDEDGGSPDQSIALGPFLPMGDWITSVVGPNMPGDRVTITTNRSVLELERDENTHVWHLDNTWSLVAQGLPSPDISSAAYWLDIKSILTRWDTFEPIFVLLDRTARRIYGFRQQEDAPPVSLGYVDIGMWVGGDSPEGIAFDGDTGEILVAVRNNGSYPYSRVLRFDVAWTSPTPTVEYLGAAQLDSGVMGLGYYLVDADSTTRLTIQDRNESPVLTRTIEGQGRLATITQALADAINQDGTYAVEVLTDPALPLMPSMLDEEDSPPDPTLYVPMTGGTDADDPTNADYLAGLEATVGRTDTAWIHAVGAHSSALWTAILLHCADMFEQHQAERFAILETPLFTSSHEEGSAGYLADLQDYVDEIVSRVAAIGDRNAVVFAGGAQFMDSDGNLYTDSIVAACGGTMAGLEVQKSLINKPVRNVLKLVPAFTEGHIQSLIQARVNCIRFKPGRGYIIAHSLTAAATGSDYSRVNDLRAVYYGSKAAREAAQIYVGEENDSAGEGLRRLESAMSRPLEVMRDAGQIDAFVLTAVSTPTDRLLGDVYVSLGIQPRRAMELIYITVYLK